MDADFTLPRLFVEDDLSAGGMLEIGGRVHHYLKNVMRQQVGDHVRLFNGRDGEYRAEIIAADKKCIRLRLEQCLRNQPDAGRKVHLLFAPLKHARQDIMIEKAVELGVDVFYPVLTDHADIRAINVERVQLQMIEAAEQSERLSVPQIMSIRPLRQVLHDWLSETLIVAAIERVGAPLIASVDVSGEKDIAVLIGPVGGWSDAEKEVLIQDKKVIAVGLGAEILRAETAAIASLAYIKFKRDGA